MGRSQRNIRLFQQKKPENARSEDKVSRKIRKLMQEEDMSHDQAVAVTLSMQKRGEL